MLLTPEEVKSITDARLAASQAEACTVAVAAGDTLNLRFARNSATSNGLSSHVRITITSEFGQQSGSVSVTSLDADALDAAQRRSEEVARAVPANPEHMPPLGPQNYLAGIAFDGETAGIGATALARGPRRAIHAARAQDVHGAGYAEAGAVCKAMGTSNGLFAYDRTSFAQLTVTARRKDGSWSGWGSGADVRFAALDAGAIAARAVGKAAHGAEPLDLDPGQYTVVLEPAATAELVAYMMLSMDARLADEGQSWLSAKGGGTKLGEVLFDPRVTLFSDPADPLAPVAVYGEDGLPQNRTAWVENGAVKALACSRYWAQKTDRRPLPKPDGIVMAGGPTPIEEMIRATKRGILVTRLWYTNELDPRTLLLTGLTRDGNFLIENGKIVGPARNFRFNESLVALLGNIDAIGPTARVHGGDEFTGPIAAPPLLVKSFNFASRSRGI